MRYHKIHHGIRQRHPRLIKKVKRLLGCIYQPVIQRILQDPRRNLQSRLPIRLMTRRHQRLQPHPRIFIHNQPIQDSMHFRLPHLFLQKAKRPQPRPAQFRIRRLQHPVQQFLIIFAHTLQHPDRLQGPTIIVPHPPAHRRSHLACRALMQLVPRKIPCPPFRTQQQIQQRGDRLPDNLGRRQQRSLFVGYPPHPAMGLNPPWIPEVIRRMPHDRVVVIQHVECPIRPDLHCRRPKRRVRRGQQFLLLWLPP